MSRTEALAASGEVPHTTWSSRFAFYLVVAGAAIGLGTLWRFPFLVGQYGGGLFVLVFTAACALIATPLLVAEFMFGRRGGANVPAAAGRVASRAGRSRAWGAIGWLGTLAIFLIMTYYSVIGGWVLAYIVDFGSGGVAGLDQAALSARFAALLADPWRLTVWHTAFMAATVLVSAAGLQRGIERGNKIMMPGLFAILIGLCLYALVEGSAARGIAFLTRADPAQLSGELVLAAVGQAFFATGVGMGIMIAYGSHVSAETSLPRSSAVVVGSIIAASVLSALLIFPLVFAFEVDPAEGPTLAFIVLPSMFIGMPGGTFVGFAFFVLLAFAAFSSAVAGLEPAAGWLVERLGIRRSAAVAVTGFAAWLIGIAMVLSFNRWADLHPLASVGRFREATLFTLTDYLAANVLLPVGALLTCMLVGWRLHAAEIEAEFGRTPRVRRALLALLRYLCPLAILAVLIGNL